jgi:hypothetical protein
LSAEKRTSVVRKRSGPTIDAGPDGRRLSPEVAALVGECPDFRQYYCSMC